MWAMVERMDAKALAHGCAGAVEALMSRWTERFSALGSDSTMHHVRLHSFHPERESGMVEHVIGCSDQTVAECPYASAGGAAPCGKGPDRRAGAADPSKSST